MRRTRALSLRHQAPEHLPPAAHPVACGGRRAGGRRGGWGGGRQEAAQLTWGAAVKHSRAGCFCVQPPRSPAVHQPLHCTLLLPPAACLLLLLAAAPPPPPPPRAAAVPRGDRSCCGCLPGSSAVLHQEESPWARDARLSLASTAPCSSFWPTCNQALKGRQAGRQASVRNAGQGCQAVLGFYRAVRQLLTHLQSATGHTKASMQACMRNPGPGMPGCPSRPLRRAAASGPPPKRHTHACKQEACLCLQTTYCTMLCVKQTGPCSRLGTSQCTVRGTHPATSQVKVAASNLQTLRSVAQSRRHPYLLCRLCRLLGRLHRLPLKLFHCIWLSLPPSSLFPCFVILRLCAAAKEAQHRCQGLLGCCAGGASRGCRG